MDPNTWMAWQIGFTSCQAYLRHLMASMWGRMSQGASRKIAMLRSTQLIKEARNEFEEILPQVIRAMGAPEGDINFTWSTDPATDEGDHVTNLLALYQQGIMTEAEIRAALNLPPMAEEDMARRDQREADTMERARLTAQQFQPQNEEAVETNGR